MTSQNIADVFGHSGALSKTVSRYQPRQEQIIMAEAVSDALKKNDTLIVEAGTGTGKTFAYLIPAILSGKKIIISTGTKNLQDQLFHRDLPQVLQALKIPCKIALLKGRANYLCHYRLENYFQQGHFDSRELASDITVVRKWLGYTNTGDIAELNDLAEDSRVWPYVTSTVDNCLSQECPFIQKCFVNKARKEALGADILIVNHHLFFADLVLREQGFGELLPSFEAVIMDEAHQVPEIAVQYFGKLISSRQVLDLCQDIASEILIHAKDERITQGLLKKIEDTLKEVRVEFGDNEQRLPWYQVTQKTKCVYHLTLFIDSLGDLVKRLLEIAERSKGLTSCYERAQLLLMKYKEFVENDDQNLVKWCELFAKSFVLHQTPMSIAERFKSEVYQKEQSWIFTSATLAIEKDFSYFADRLGLNKENGLQLTSPFNYKQQALLYVPRGIPDYRHPDFMEKLCDVAKSVIEKAKGRTFFLFTSFRALREAQQILSKTLDLPLLIQGEAPKANLIQQFITLGNAVLLGTSSFWEGVDIRGQALSCVIIDKLPFASPFDPVTQAYIKHLEKLGKSPFDKHQLPNAVISLKQGAGRLIRDVDDSGVLMIGDLRLIARSYGMHFLQSLPKMKRTRDLSEVLDFFEEGQA